MFIPYAKKKRVDPNKPILLTMDGHDTHEKHEIQRVIYKQLDDENLEIILLCFPSKTTHKCQPLDVVVFASVERGWQEVCDRCVKEGKPINRFTLIPEYIKGTRGAMTKELIKKAFERTGLYPVNRNVFQPEDFAPSKASSSVAHVPDSFPYDVPSSDPIEPSDDDYKPSDNDGPNSDCRDEEMDDEEETESLPVASDDEAKDDNHDCPFPSPLAEDQHDQDITIDDADTTEKETDDVPNTIIVSGLMASMIARIENSAIHATRSTTARLDLFTSAPPKTVSLEEDSRRSFEELLNVVRLLREQLLCIFEAHGRALGQLSASDAHCTTIHRELGNVRVQLDNATKKKERGSKKIKARFLTGANLRAEFERQDAERQEQEHVAAEKEKQKEAENVERAQRVANDALNRDFEGRLTSYKKDDLRALAIALSVSDKGTNGELLSRIEDCFKKNPDLKNNSRFSSLFSKRRKVTVAGTQEDTALDQAPQSQQQPELPPSQALTTSIVNTFGASHPAIPTSRVHAAGPSHASVSNPPPFPQPVYYTNNLYHQFHAQNGHGYLYNASHIAPPGQPTIFPLSGHGYISPQSAGSHLNPVNLSPQHHSN